MLKLFITGILVTSLLVSGCVSETSNDPWNGNLYLDSNEKIRSLDPTKEKLYSSQGTEELDEVVKKMPYKVKLPTISLLKLRVFGQELN